MPINFPLHNAGHDASFKVFHELMSRKITDILLVSTPYDAWIMEEDGRLSERIVTEYKGLNLSKPPRLTWVDSAEEALARLEAGNFDMVITMPRLADADAYDLGQRIKARHADLPVILLSHRISPELFEEGTLSQLPGIDRHFVWSGNKDLLVAIVKSTEDRLNAAHDTELAGVRIILFVEDSPVHISSLLPIFYNALVHQTRAVLEGKLNEEHRLLTMRARPKILVSSSYEQALADFQQFEPYVLGVISDVQFPRDGEVDANAGLDFLSLVKRERFDIPLLLTSDEPGNKARADALSALFVHKSSPTLYEEVNDFFKHYLAFDEFVFRLPNGAEVARAFDLRSLERRLRDVPAESLLFHARRNDFSRWLFTRTETELASSLRDVTVDDFPDVEALRKHLVSVIHARRTERQMGIVADFDPNDIDMVTRFFKLGRGSLGGKARGLAFVSALLRRNEALRLTYSDVRLFVPRTLVVTTEAFEEFVESHDLKYLAEADLPNQEISRQFLAHSLPASLENDLRSYLRRTRYPLAVRSSSLLEDAQFRAYAGLYYTFMLPNEHFDIESRLRRLLHAIKLVYASTYFQGPKAFSRRVGRRIEEEKMAVIVQQLVGERYGDYFYPAISGVAQSHNYYPFARMRPEEGIATIALGLGRAVVEGEKTLRFSPARPQVLPQQSTVKDTLANAQRFFYALRMGGEPAALSIEDFSDLEKREVTDARDEPPVQLLASTYVPQEQRIRDTMQIPGHPVLTFARILKYKYFPLPEILTDVLAMGQKGMGVPVEMEFSVNFKEDERCKPEFAFLQLRPMTARAELLDVDITAADRERAFCYSNHALGNAQHQDMHDIVYVKPQTFDRAHTVEIAQEIGRHNARIESEGCRYLLIGPGRWGTADRWLGIPVHWRDISAVGAIVETALDDAHAEPSQGSHFFHNITTLGINYITICCDDESFCDWDWLVAQPIAHESEAVAHVRLPAPLMLKVDGRSSRCAIIARDAARAGNEPSRGP